MISINEILIITFMQICGISLMIASVTRNDFYDIGFLFLSGVFIYFVANINLRSVING